MNNRQPSPFLIVGFLVAGVVAVGLPWLALTRFKTELAFGVLFLGFGLLVAGWLRRKLRLGLPRRAFAAIGFWVGIVVGHLVSSAAISSGPAGKVASPDASAIDSEKATGLIVNVFAWGVSLALIASLLLALVGGPWSDKSATSKES